VLWRCSDVSNITALQEKELRKNRRTSLMVDILQTLGLKFQSAHVPLQAERTIEEIT
jgi:hypothetical protein